MGFILKGVSFKISKSKGNSSHNPIESPNTSAYSNSNNSQKYKYHLSSGTASKVTLYNFKYLRYNLSSLIFGSHN
jgi:hypothetical protein